LYATVKNGEFGTISHMLVRFNQPGIQRYLDEAIAGWSPKRKLAAALCSISVSTASIYVATSRERIPLSIYQNMGIAPVIDGRLQALDAETVKVQWEALVAYQQDDYTITMAPRIARGKVIIGVRGGDRPTRGFFARTMR